MIKRIRKSGRSILFLTLAFVVLICSGCSKEVGQETTGKDEVTTTWEEEEVQYRVCITGDVHYAVQREWFGWSNEDRLQFWVDTILEEHEREPFDLIIINGDTSLDYWVSGGTMYNFGVSQTEMLMNDYISQLPQDVPVVVLPGNHEQYSDEKWRKLTGNGRSETYVLGNNLFVMPDSFGENLEPDYNYDGTETVLDAAYIRKAMEKYPDHNVYIISHYINPERQSGAFWRICHEENVRGMFSGHTHAKSILFPTLGSGKTIAQTGNFAHDDKIDVEDGTWGIRDLIITENHAVSRYVTADCAMVVNDKPMHFKRQILNVVEYY